MDTGPQGYNFDFLHSGTGGQAVTKGFREVELQDTDHTRSEEFPLGAG